MDTLGELPIIRADTSGTFLSPYEDADPGWLVSSLGSMSAQPVEEHDPRDSQAIDLEEQGPARHVRRLGHGGRTSSATVLRSSGSSTSRGPRQLSPGRRSPHLAAAVTATAATNAYPS